MELYEVPLLGPAAWIPPRPALAPRAQHPHVLGVVSEQASHPLDPRCGALLRGLCEVLAGRRSVVQLEGFSSPRALEELSAAVGHGAGAVRVLAIQDRDDVVEVALRWCPQDRARAVAVQLTRRGEWRCTAVETAPPPSPGRRRGR